MTELKKKPKRKIKARLNAGAPVSTSPNLGAEEAGGGIDHPAVVKLIDYAKEKKTIYFEEIADYLPEHIANSDKIEQVLALLAENNVQIVEEDLSDDDDGAAKSKAETEKKSFIYNEKEPSFDDPIRLYLREIGREHLLNAELEVSLSKQMEEGENIIKGVIKKSGMIIPEFYQIAQKAFS